jgi:hypothetical protein
MPIRPRGGTRNRNRYIAGAANRNESTRSSIPPVARDQPAGVLRAGCPLEHRYGDVADLRGRRDEPAEDDAEDRISPERPETHRGDDHGADGAAGDTRHVFDGEMCARNRPRP